MFQITIKCGDFQAVIGVILLAHICVLKSNFPFNSIGTNIFSSENRWWTNILFYSMLLPQSNREFEK